ncbi:MAG: isopropylmalate isomerase [Sphingomicrobium sp.]|nr:isopropylmalate isomerase [Sphingomonadales bacterium]
MSEDKKDDGGRTASLVKAGFAAGIGSAAIVAALLYASRSRKPKTGKKAKGSPPATD